MSKQVEDFFILECKKCGSKKVGIYSTGEFNEITIKCKDCVNEFDSGIDMIFTYDPNQ